MLGLITDFISFRSIIHPLLIILLKMLSNPIELFNSSTSSHNSSNNWHNDINIQMRTAQKHPTPHCCLLRMRKSSFAESVRVVSLLIVFVASRLRASEHHTSCACVSLSVSVSVSPRGGQCASVVINYSIVYGVLECLCAECVCIPFTTPRFVSASPQCSLFCGVHYNILSLSLSLDHIILHHTTPIKKNCARGVKRKTPPHVKCECDNFTQIIRPRPTLFALCGDM